MQRGKKKGKIFGMPIDVVRNEDMLDAMKHAPTGTVFVIGENVIKEHEGDDTVELVMAQIIRTHS